MTEKDILKCMITQNDCYKIGAKMTPKGIVVHDTAAGNPWLNRYTQPADNDPNKDKIIAVIGKNKYNNHWNKPDVEKAVHAFIGKKADGELAVLQCMPWDIKPWGCGGGKKGSYNNSHIQFEIQDDNYKAGSGTKEYFEECMEKAIDLCAYLAKLYNIPVSEIICHKEAYERGYGSNHSDTIPWMKKYGWTMDMFRDKVAAKLKATETKPAEKTEPKEEEKLAQKEVYYVVHAGAFGDKNSAQAAVNLVKKVYPDAYVASFNGVYYARCELNKNRNYALANAEKLEGLVKNPGIYVK